MPAPAPGRPILQRVKPRASTVHLGQAHPTSLRSNKPEHPKLSGGVAARCKLVNRDTSRRTPMLSTLSAIAQAVDWGTVADAVLKLVGAIIKAAL
ncbi:hypothetical protein Ntsu_04410 [Nocardia sp. IFM 10818]